MTHADIKLCPWTTSSSCLGSSGPTVAPHWPRVSTCVLGPCYINKRDGGHIWQSWPQAKTTEILTRWGAPSWIFALAIEKWVPSIFPCMACLSETLVLPSLGLWCFNMASFGLNSASFGLSCSLWKPSSVFTNSYGKTSPRMFYTLKWKHLIKTAICWLLLKGPNWLKKHMEPEIS